MPGTSDRPPPSSYWEGKGWIRPEGFYGAPPWMTVAEFEAERKAKRKQQANALIETVKKAGKRGLTRPELLEELGFTGHELREALKVAEDQKFRVRRTTESRPNKNGRPARMTVFVRGNGKPPPEVLAKREAEAARRRGLLERERERWAERDRREAAQQERLEKVRADLPKAIRAARDAGADQADAIAGWIMRSPHRGVARELLAAHVAAKLQR